MAQPVEQHEHAWEQIPRSWPPRFRCSVKRCTAIGRIQRSDEELPRPQIAGWTPEQLRPGSYMQEIIDGT